MPMLSFIVAALLQAAPAAAPSIDPILAEWTNATPGCAVGVELDGRTVLEKGFGMADLERGVPNRGDTIFEAGSVSKQFTAAAVLLLARDGKLSLDDEVRKYVPELPDYGTPLTIRHMLTHTSGLRDWGSVEAIAGWPRTSREYTHAHVLDILSRQRALNFTPGTRWSYSNSGFNLAAIIVSRVSGMSFAEFTKQRIFQPLGMTHTSWRDDHTRIVPGRALAYQKQSDGYHTEMPFENVHGNGGLLTTVGDLLIWTRNFRHPVVGDTAFVTEQTTPGRFSDGQAHDYGMGVWVGEYRGLREVRHSGSTAGYRAYLTTFPDASSGVAVLCNAANASADSVAYKVADQMLAAKLKPSPERQTTYVLTDAETTAVLGLYRDVATGVPSRIVKFGDRLRVERGPLLYAESGSRFHGASGQQWVFGDGGRVTITDAFGRTNTLERVSPWTPTADQLAAFAGEYTSAEAETAFTAAVVDGTLVLRQHPDRVMVLTPVYENAFSSSLGTVRFVRDAGKARAMTVTQDRVWLLRFTRRVSEAKSEK